MRSQLVQRFQSVSLNSVPPPKPSSEYSVPLAGLAARILYLSPLPSASGLPIYILNAEAFPDSKDVDYSGLLPYVLARLPSEDDLVTGQEYEVVFFAGGGGDGATAVKKGRPGFGWFIQAYNVLPRATRKRLQKLYIVHEKSWVGILFEIFFTIISPKFRRKIVHASTLTGLALHIPIEDLLIPPSAYLHDRTLSSDIHAPYASCRRAFGARQPLPTSSDGARRLPRVLREASSFVLMESNIGSEGLFRISPHSRLLGVLREAYDRGQKFIIWRGNDSIVCFPEPENIPGHPFVEELDIKDGYDVHTAAGLIKMWYSKLHEPLFPQPCYRRLRNLFGDEESPISIDRLTDLISPHSKWSDLSSDARFLLTTHLIPLLSTVADHEGSNKMSPFNLAVCFAPSLLCGTDAIEDAKMGGLIRRILCSMIEAWDLGLRDACNVRNEAFSHALRAPTQIADYEDPLIIGSPTSSHANHFQSVRLGPQPHGITLLDNEDALHLDKDTRPRLPPRRRSPTNEFPPERLNTEVPVVSDKEKRPDLPPRRHSPTPTNSTARSTVEQPFAKRKPAPTVPVPPRYSISGLQGHDDHDNPTQTPSDTGFVEAINPSTTGSPPLYSGPREDDLDERPCPI